MINDVFLNRVIDLKSKIDKEKRKIIIKNVRVRCGNKTIFKKKCKTKTSTRILYLPKILIDIIELDEKRIEQNKQIYGNNYIESPFLCVADNGRPLRVDYMSSQFKKVFDKFIENETQKNSNFKFPYITLHKLRHLNLSILLANGINLTDVRDAAGHSDIHTTMIYTHNYTEGKKATADKIDEIYSPLLNFKIS